MIVSDSNLLGEIVRDNHNRIAAFESFGIDCKLNSERTLFEICEKRTIDLRVFVEVIDTIDGMRNRNKTV